MSSELKPCPFCGGEAKTLHVGDWWVEHACKKLGTYIRTRFCETEEEAVAWWNTRAQTVFGMTLDEVRQMMKRDAERERTCHMSIDDYGICKCDKCGWYDYWNNHEDPNYCPVCGAKAVE